MRIHGPERPWRCDTDEMGLTYLITYNVYWMECERCEWEATFEAYLLHWWPPGPREPYYI